MFEAGSAFFTLGGHVIRSGFEDYGRLVEQARAQKEHQVELGARTSPRGFEQYQAQLEKLKANLSKTVEDAKGSWLEVSRATERMASVSDASLAGMRRSLGETSGSFDRLGGAARGSARLVGEADAQMLEGHRGYGNAVIKINEEVAASNRQAAASAGGGGGRGAAGGAGGAAGQDPVAQAKRVTGAWRGGFDTLATMGKWATVAILGVGGVSLKMAANFQKQMELVRTQAGYSQKDVDGLKKSVLDLAPAVGTGPTKLAEGLFHIASSGIPAAHAMEFLKVAAEGAKVGNADLEQVTNALVGIMRTAPKDIHSVGEAMAVLNDIVGHGNLRMEELTAAIGTGLVAAGKAVGLGLRDVGAALDVLTTRGIPAQEGATRLRTVLGLVANPTNKAQKALDELGFSHDRLAKDFRSKGLVGALADLQGAMQHTFGHKLTIDQERQALTAYAQQLKDSGASTNTITKALVQYKRELETSGEGAIKASSLIAQAFGGARMGTTMQILMQNVDDVRNHFDQLNKAGAAGRFQNAWHATQKTFSEEASTLGASAQVLGIRLGTHLIPKVEALVKWLIEAGKWMGRHKALAEALAYAFGTLLAAAIVAFFARFIERTAKGVASVGKFAESIWNLPNVMKAASEKLAANLDAQRVEINKNITAMDELAAAAEGATGAPVAGGGSRGGAAAAAEGGVGSIIGMITGIRGVEAPGSEMNPLAVQVIGGLTGGAGRGLGVSPGALREVEQAEATGGKAAANEIVAAHKTGGKIAADEIAASEASGGRVAGEEIAAGAASGGRIAAEEIAAGEVAGGGGAGALAGVKSRAAGLASTATSLAGEVGSRLLRGGMGVLLAQSIGSLIPGAVGRAVKNVGTGAAIGSMFGPWGMALGGALGGAITLLIHHGKSEGEKWAERFTSTLPGHVSNAVKKGLAQGQDNAPPVPGRPPSTAPGSRLGPSMPQPGSPEFRQEVVRFTRWAGQQGAVAGRDWVKQWHSVKTPSEFSVIGSVEKQLSEVPKKVRQGGAQSVAEWRNSAAKGMLEYATSLERNGKLPRGAVDRIIIRLEQRFGPGLTAYLEKTGHANEKAIADSMKFHAAQKNLQDAVNNFRDQWGLQWQFARTTNHNVYKNAATMMDDLQTLMHDKSKKTRQLATAEWHLLRKEISDTFDRMVANVSDKQSRIAGLVAKGTAGAARAAGLNMADFEKSVRTAVQSGVMSAADGATKITEAINAELKTFKAHQVPLAQVEKVLQASEPKHMPVFQGRGHAGTFEGGGVLPGAREFGRGDVMTLVDPRGRPVASMAGDENIFTRHQMPFVEAGLQMLGFNGAEDLWHRVNRPHGYESGGALKKLATGGYVYPLQGARIGRTDQGVDASMAPGSPIGAIGKSRVIGHQANWYAGQPFMWWQLTDGPRAGQYVYLAEQITGLAPPGARLSANQAAARFASHGTGLEMGWATAGGSTLARSTSGYSEGQVTPAGADFRAFITGLSHGVIRGGGALGGLPAWQDIKSPHVRGGGTIARQVQVALNHLTNEENREGSKRAGAMGNLMGFHGGGDAVANQRLGKAMMLAAGWGAGQWPYLYALWNQESSWSSTAVNPSSGAYGIPQALGHGHPYNLGDAAAQIRWGLNYIKQRYGSPAAAEAHERSFNWYRRGGKLPGFRAGGSLRGRGKGHVTKRKRQPLSQRTANLLKSVGLGTFVSDQNRLGQLDTQYSSQETLFNTFDAASGAGLPVQDLNILQGIREQQWDILFGEWQALPGAIDTLQKRVTHLAGHRPGTVRHFHPGGRHAPGANAPGHYTYTHRPGTGVAGLTAEVDHDEKQIADLKHQLTVDARKQATIRHNITGQAMNIASKTASEMAGALDGLARIADERYSLSRKRNALHQREANLPPAPHRPKAPSTSDPNVGSIVTGVLSGQTGTGSSGSSGAPPDPSAPIRRHIRKQLADLHGQDLTLSHRAAGLHQALRGITARKAEELRRLRAHGFEAAWAIQLQRWRIQDKITALQAKLKRLKASLSEEKTRLKAAQDALTQVKGWQTGGLQGDQSVLQSLGDIGMDLLDLYQQGADLPTSGRKQPTLQGVETILRKLGLTIPSDITGGGALTASAAFQEFMAFQADRANLFSQFGGNFVPAGRSAFTTPAGLGAGTQFYGAAPGPVGARRFAQGGTLGGGSHGPGSTTFDIDINQQFAAGPPDPHTHAQGLAFELRAAV